MSKLSSVFNSYQTPVNTSSYSLPRKQNLGLYFNIGIFCAFISLVVVPEIFGSAAIILGAYVWRMERDENRNRGLVLIIFGIIAMLVGIYYTSYFALYDILP
jgi:membrane-bound ClpP family serine protease